ncbi:MAG: phage head protein [Desulfurellales bacterium]|nr:MAG: phage head protein [Desulfurellales bacterium]
MAAPTNTMQTYTAVVNFEDLSDMVYMISPTETPFVSGIAKSTASSTLHEWTTDTLATAANNAQIEGDDSTAGVINPGTRVNNRTQISRKVIRLSGTQQSVKSAGNLYTKAKQIAKAGLELRRDVEVALTQNTTAVTGAAATARQTRGLEGWIATNNSLGASGVAPNPNTNTAPTDGTQRAFTETLLKDVIQKCFSSGGSPDTVMLGPTQKQTFSTFTGGMTQMGNADDNKLVAAFNFYVSDFGTLKAVPNRFQRARTAFVLEMQKFAFATLRDFKTEDLAKTGDSDASHIIVEYTLEARNEASSGAVRDLT